MELGSIPVFGSFGPKWSYVSPGTVVLIKALEKFCQESEVNIMDYGFSHALYKSNFGTNRWMEENAYIYAPRLRPILIYIAMTADLAFCGFLNKTTSWLNIDSWVRQHWRKMMLKNSRKETTKKKGNIELQS